MRALPGGRQRPEGRAVRRRRARAKVSAVVLLVVVVALGGGLLWLGTPTPLVTVMSPSMAPTLDVGEIALMGALRREPQVGDIVEIPVPPQIQRDKNYPKSVVHRIVEISDGRVRTQGDNLEEPDPFDAPIEAIDRRLVRVVPGAGRLVTFVFSPFGLIWIGAGLVLFVAYPLVERSRERHEVEQVATKQRLDHVVAAVADYGYHLKSHTEILMAMSQAAQDLSAVVARLEGRVEPGAVALAPPGEAVEPARDDPPQPRRPVAAPRRRVPAVPGGTRPVRTRPLSAPR